MQKNLMITLVAFLAISFSPAAQAQTTVSARLQAQVDGILSIVDQTQATPASVDQAVKRLLADIPAVKIIQFKKHEFSGAQKTLVPEIFGRRMVLRQRMAQLYHDNQLTEATARGVQSAMRYLRGVEDYLGYVDSNHKDVAIKEGTGLKYVLPDLAQIPASLSLLPVEQTLVNPYFYPVYKKDPSQLRLQSGDLLLSRGSAATSSAIARLADEDTQFSHVGMVYVDSKTGKGYTIEAHIELGVLATPIEKWFTDGKKRTVVYRYRDPTVAAEAGRKMYEYVTKYQKEHKGENIPYDFGFDMYDRKQIFCSEVVRVGYELGSGGSVKVPLFPAKLTPKNRAFLDQLGIKQTESFIPADLEADPRFEVLAEWRNFGGLRESWVSDAITTKIYEWMENEGLKYDPSSMMELAGKALTGMRSSRWTSWMVKTRVAPNADKETVAVMLTIVKLYSDVHEELEAREKKLRRETPFSLFEAMDQLEQLRKEKPKLFSKVLN